LRNGRGGKSPGREKAGRFPSSAKRNYMPGKGGEKGDAFDTGKKTAIPQIN